MYILLVIFMIGWSKTKMNSCGYDSSIAMYHDNLNCCLSPIYKLDNLF